MVKQEVIDTIKYAAAAGDLKQCTRLYCENRISRATYDRAVEAGRQMAQRIGNPTSPAASAAQSAA